MASSYSFSVVSPGLKPCSVEYQCRSIGKYLHSSGYNKDRKHVVLPYRFRNKYSTSALYMYFTIPNGNEVIFNPTNIQASNLISTSSFDHLVYRVAEFALSYYLKLNKLDALLNIIQPLEYRYKHISKINRLSIIAVNSFMNFIKKGIAHE